MPKEMHPKNEEHQIFVARSLNFIPYELAGLQEA